MVMPPHAATARSLLRRLYPWIGKAVHTRWRRRRAEYQEEAQELLAALSRYTTHIPPSLALRLEGYLARLHQEWFPDAWRPTPTYAEVVSDFRWWLGMAERWNEEAPKPRGRRPQGPRAKQPAALLELLRLPRDCTQEKFLASWRRFLKANHPDLNPDQSPEQRRRFKEAVALWRR
jgi:hypothetical protein